MSLFVSGAALSGQTFFVATDGSDASGNDGSMANPWATITHALDNVPDGALILVRPGTYNGGVRLRGTFAQGVTVRSEIPYQARLRHNAAVVFCYTGQGIALEGFDIAHSAAGGALVVQIQDLIDGAEATSRITLRNNIIHDSLNNDLLKINNGARDVVVEGNMFYNQAGSDEHIDVNSVVGVVIQDNLFFNDFAGSGRVNDNSTSSYIVIKDSNSDDDGITGADSVIVRRNILFHWEGSPGQGFVRCGEDGAGFYEATNVLIENNLMIGHAVNLMRAPFQAQGCSDITFRNNTITGDTPCYAMVVRLYVTGSNLPNRNIRLLNNVWSDPSGTFGAQLTGADDFSDTPPGETESFELRRNLYWNAGNPLPSDGAELVNSDDDVEARTADPQLPASAGLVLPRWDAGMGEFADGSASIREAFERLAFNYGQPAAASPLRDDADPAHAPADDLLGRARSQPDLGCFEIGAQTGGSGGSTTASSTSGGGSGSGTSGGAGGDSGGATGGSSGAGATGAGTGGTSAGSGSTSGGASGGSSTTGAGADTGGGTGGGEAGLAEFPWTLVLVRPKEGASVRPGFAALFKVRESDLAKRTFGLGQAMIVSSNGPATDWVEAARVSKVNGKGRFKFKVKGLAPDAVSGSSVVLWGRASTNWAVGSTPTNRATLRIR